MGGFGDWYANDDDMARFGGISNTGAAVEVEFRRLTGAVEAERAAYGDAIVEGHYVEIKKASSMTLNQVRAVKYITLVVYSAAERQWFVVPANEIVRQCSQKKRGQHTENPFESSTMSVRNLGQFVVDNPLDLKDRVLAAVEEAEAYPELNDLMKSVLEKSKQLALESRTEALGLLSRYGES